MGALLLAGLSHDEEHPRTVLNVSGRRQLASQEFHDEVCFLAVKTARIAAAVLLREKLCCPLIVNFPELVEEFFGEARSCFHGVSIHGWLYAIFRDGWTLEISIFGDGRLVARQSPQPRNVNAEGREIVHEPQLEFVVVDGSGK